MEVDGTRPDASGATAVLKGDADAQASLGEAILQNGAHTSEEKIEGAVEDNTRSEEAGKAEPNDVQQGLQPANGAASSRKRIREEDRTPAITSTEDNEGAVWAELIDLFGDQMMPYIPTQQLELTV